MLVAAAVCPHPPLLVPAVGVGAAGEVDALRDRCAEVVRSVFDGDADTVFVVGPDTGPRATSMQPWAPGAAGADRPVDVPEPLPLSLLVGGWVGRGGRRSFRAGA